MANKHQSLKIVNINSHRSSNINRHKLYRHSSSITRNHQKLVLQGLSLVINYQSSIVVNCQHQLSLPISIINPSSTVINHHMYIINVDHWSSSITNQQSSSFININSHQLLMKNSHYHQSLSIISIDTQESLTLIDPSHQSSSITNLISNIQYTCHVIHVWWYHTHT